MKLTYFIPNFLLTAVMAGFVLLGSFVYVTNTHPIAKIQDQTEATPSAVLSDQDQSSLAPVNPVLLLPPIIPPVIPPGPIPTPTSVSSTPQPSAPAQQITTQITSALSDLSQGNTANLANYISSDLLDTFGAAAVAQALTSSYQTYGSIVNITPLSDPNITGNYADQKVAVTTTKGTYNYQVFLKNESGIWKIIGTEPLP